MIASTAATLRQLSGRFLRDEAGATAIEYSLIATLIAVVCIGAFNALGNSSTGSWGTMTAKVTAAMK